MKRLTSLPPAANFVLTVAVAAIGGALLAAIDFPAGWLSGALIAVTMIALAGFPAHVPDGARRVVFIVLGITMGSAVTPETIAGVRSWPITMFFLILSIPAAMSAVVLYLKWAGWDREVSRQAAGPRT